MQKPTQEDIVKTVDRLKMALLKEFEVRSTEQEIKRQLIASHNEVCLAREEVRALSL